MPNSINANITIKIVTILIRLTAFLSRLWIPSWVTLVLLFLGLLSAVAWTGLTFSSFTLSPGAPGWLIDSLALVALLILFFLLLTSIPLRFDLGLISFYPTWRNSSFDFKKKFNESKSICYMTTVGRFLKEEVRGADFKNAMSNGKKFRGLFLEPHGSNFKLRMEKERPGPLGSNKYVEPRKTQLNDIKSLLSANTENIQIRWYDFQPSWRLIIFDDRYVVVGWFPDYAPPPPKGNENKGYSSPMLVLDAGATMRKVKIDVGLKAPLAFPMATLAKGFIDYFESVWNVSGNDLKLVDMHHLEKEDDGKRLQKIESEHSLKNLSDIGINSCWKSEEVSPYTFLTQLRRTDLKKYRYLELSARAIDVGKVVDMLRKRRSDSEDLVDCDILLYDPRTVKFRYLIEREGRSLDSAIDRQSEFISKLVTAKQYDYIKDLNIRFTKRPPFLRSVMMECKNESILFLGYYINGAKGYKNKYFRLTKSTNNDLYLLYEEYFEKTWNTAFEFDYGEFQTIKNEINLLKYLMEKYPIQ